MSKNDKEKKNFLLTQHRPYYLVEYVIVFTQLPKKESLLRPFFDSTSNQHFFLLEARYLL